jgi:hypothetical protein
MSDNFPNIVQNASEQSMNVGMSDPNNSSFLGATNMGPWNGKQTPDYGRSKITKSADAPHPTEQVGYGYMSPALKDVGMAPSGENSSGIPAAQPIDPITFGDPNDTSLDFRDNYMEQGTEVTKRGFDTPV